MMTCPTEGGCSESLISISRLQESIFLLFSQRGDTFLLIPNHLKVSTPTNILQCVSDVRDHFQIKRHPDHKNLIKNAGMKKKARKRPCRSQDKVLLLPCYFNSKN